MGIEPNEHQIPRFLGKYSYHTDHLENPESPHSPNVLTMSGVMLRWGILRFCESQCFSVKLKRQWDWSENPLNFPESGWWGRVLSNHENTDSNCYRFVGGWE